MGFFNGDTSSGVAVPWAIGPDAFLKQIQEEISFDSLVLGLIDVRDPRPDAFLAASGVEPAALEQWCDSGHKTDPTLREARRKGVVLGKTAKNRPGPAMPASHQVMVRMMPTVLGSRRWWYLGLSRRSTAFNEQEQQQAGLLLRVLQAEFDHLGETGLGRTLLNADYQLIHADARSEGRWLRDDGVVGALATVLPGVIEQRWPTLADAATHDIALELAGQPRWVRFRRLRAAEGMPRPYWYLELRPLEEGDIPPVGVVEDPRVAAAIAFLTDRYASAPTLTEVAEAVQTSPFHFHRLFVRHVGLSPKHYLLRMQLMMAKWMLRATRKAIGDIATATGFASHGHFTATFHRIVGVSPSTYREER